MGAVAIEVAVEATGIMVQGEEEAMAMIEMDITLEVDLETVTGTDQYATSEIEIKNMSDVIEDHGTTENVMPINLDEIRQYDPIQEIQRELTHQHLDLRLDLPLTSSMSTAAVKRIVDPARIQAEDPLAQAQDQLYRASQGSLQGQSRSCRALTEIALGQTHHLPLLKRLKYLHLALSLTKHPRLIIVLLPVGAL